MKEEGDGSSSESTDLESSYAAPSNSKVSSSTNGTGKGVSVITSPLRRSLTLEKAEAVSRAHLVGNALVALGTEVVAAAAAAAAVSSPLSFCGPTIESNRLFLNDFGSSRTITSGTGSNKSSGSDGSNSASPLSLNLSKPGPKPRAADSPGSGSTTSTTTTTPSRDKVFRCTICDRSFGYKHVLQNHERTHTGEKPFECRECHKRFTRDHHLKTHMRLHTGEKPYHCDHCERQFVQVANLRRHLRVHTGERPYACELCVSKFSDSNQLKAHMLIHKGEKPFECEKCLGRFRRRHHLMHHKCPKDEANIGKPRRGRRPKAYDQLGIPPLVGSGDEAQSLPGVATATVTSSTAALAVAATSSYYPIQTISMPSVPGLPLTTSPPAAHSGTGCLHPIDSTYTSSKSRRKPVKTMRIVNLSAPQILTPQQKAMLMQSTHNIQTEPINLSSLSPSYDRKITFMSRGSAAFLTSQHQDDVLDLSRSRSDVDSEPEAIEEDADGDGMTDEDEEEEMDLDHPL